MIPSDKNNSLRPFHICIEKRKSIPADNSAGIDFPTFQVEEIGLLFFDLEKTFYTVPQRCNSDLMFYILSIPSSS